MEKVKDILKFEKKLKNEAEKLQSTDFSSIQLKLNPTEMVNKYQEILQKLVGETFPLKTIKISDQDQPWFTEELRALKRTRLREYVRHGKSVRYAKLMEKFEKKLNKLGLSCAKLSTTYASYQ